MVNFIKPASNKKKQNLKKEKEINIESEFIFVFCKFLIHIYLFYIFFKVEAKPKIFTFTLLRRSNPVFLMLNKIRFLKVQYFDYMVDYVKYFTENA
jgi:hypothetical protein